MFKFSAYERGFYDAFSMTEKETCPPISLCCSNIPLFRKVDYETTVFKMSKLLENVSDVMMANVLHAGMIDTSAVTMLFTPRLDRAPLTRPHVKARYCRDTSSHLCHITVCRDWHHRRISF